MIKSTTKSSKWKMQPMFRKPGSLQCYLLQVCFFFLIFVWAGSWLLCTGCLSLWWVSVTPCCSAWASHWGGCFCCWAQALVVVACRHSSCATWTYLLCGMWSLLRLGIEPVSPAGEFFSTAKPGKSWLYIFTWCFFHELKYCIVPTTLSYWL